MNVKFKHRILLILLVLLVSIQPVLVSASSISSLNNESYDLNFQLFKVTEPIDLDNKISILEGTILYGFIEDELVHIQYKDKYIGVSSNQLENITYWNKNVVPTFIDHQTLDKNDESIMVINQGTLYGHSMESDETLQLHSEIEVFQLYNEEYEYILVGNVPHFLNSEEFEKATAESTEKEESIDSDVEREVDSEDDEVEEIVDSEEEMEEEQETIDSQNVNGEDDESKDMDLTESNIEEEEQNINDQLGAMSINQQQNRKKLLEVVFSESDKFFLANDNLPVYDNRSGELVQVGELKKGQIYPRYESSPSWHLIQFGEYKAFVKKEGTEPALGTTLKNINESYTNQDKYIIGKKDITVYDNSSGNLIPFGTIKAGQKFSIAYDYGGAWIYIIFADRVGFIKSDDLQKDYFLESDKYFRVTEESLPIYDRRDGKLVKVGELLKDQIYYRYESSPSWHQIQFGDKLAFVPKDGTQPIKGLNVPIDNSSSNQYYVAKQDITVYDNTSGSLVPYGKIQEGEVYPVTLDYGGEWLYVNFADRLVYIKSSDFNKLGDFSNSDKYFKVLEDGLPIYDNRSGNLVKVGELVREEVYPRGVGSPNWHAIDFNGYTAYVKTEKTIPANGKEVKNKNNGKYKNQLREVFSSQDITVYDNTSGTLKPFAKIAKGQKYSIARDYYGDWIYVILADRIGYIRSSEVKRTFIPSDKYFKITDKNTSIYDNRSGKLVKVGELVKDQVYERGVGSPAWQAVDFGDFQGYVSTSQAEPSNGKSITNFAKTTTSIGYITTKVKVPVYDNSGSGNMVTFAYVEKGKRYPVVKEYNSWYEINLGGRYGFVKRSDVTANLGIKIFLDPGHGGHDSGGIGYGVMEKDIVLDIGLKTANYLRSNYHNVDVQLSRTTDVFIPLEGRAQMANDWRADYFVSLHTNAHNGSANGFETFIYNGSVSKETKNRQKDIHNYMINRMNAYNRGMKSANFSVLRNSEMPSILLEYLFIDNYTDNQLLRSSSYRSSLARITAEAIANSFDLTKK